MNIKEFISEIKKHGLKIAVGNSLICFTKWFTGAKRIQLTFK